MKRFWKEAAVAPGADGFVIHLDGRPMRMPGGPQLVLRGLPLAEAIRDEWQAAGGGPGGEMTYDHVPLTRLAGTAQQRVAADPMASVDALAQYGETDLLCYRATHPEPLIRRQEEHWRPWLDWAALDLDAPLLVTSGIVHIAQPPDALRALRARLATHNPETLAGLGIAIPVLGSLVLGLALAEGKLDAARAHELSLLDELFQEEAWGEDFEATKRRAHVAADLAVAERFIRLSQ